MLSRNAISGLRVALQCAVPLWQARIRGYDDATCLRRAKAAGDIIAHYGDALQYGRSKGDGRNLVDLWLRRGADEYGYRDDPFKPTSPSPGEIFNALAEGIAIGLRMNPDAPDIVRVLLNETYDDSAVADHRSGEAWEECKSRRRQERRQ